MTILHNNFSLEGAAEADCLAIGLRGNKVRFGAGFKTGNFKTALQAFAGAGTLTSGE